MYLFHSQPEKTTIETEMTWEDALVTHSTERRWNKDGDYFRQGLLVKVEPSFPEGVVPHSEIIDAIYSSFRQRCSCEHDCCGHVFSSVHNVRQLNGNRYLVVMTGGRNV